MEKAAMDISLQSVVSALKMIHVRGDEAGLLDGAIRVVNSVIREIREQKEENQNDDHAEHGEGS